MANPISEYLSQIGRKGAKTRWARMSRQERVKEMSRRRRLGMKREKKEKAGEAEPE